MTNRRTLLNLLGAGAVAALSTVWTAGAATAQEVTLKMHQFLPAQANVPTHILDVWADNIERDSEGRIKIERYPSMQLGGKPPELIDQVMDGVADVIWTVVGYTPGRFPRTEVFELPFMMTTPAAASRAYWEMFETHMKDTEFKDVHIVGTWVHGPGLIHTYDPVEQPDDLRGMKIRGGSRQVNALLTKLGATPVGMPVPAVPEALSKGVLDGTTIPWEVTPSLKVQDLVENHTEFAGQALYTLTFVLAMNKEKYEALPDDLKQVVDQNSGLEFSVFAAKTMSKYDALAREMIDELGNNIITLDADQAAAWRDAAAPVIADWVKDMDSKGLDGQALIDEAQTLIKKYSE